MISKVRRKIQKTRLFSDPQKVELLVKLEGASDEDVRKLEEGIDAFDREYGKAMEKRGAEIRERLAAILKDMPEDERNKNQEAIDEVLMGTALLKPAN